MCVAAKVYEKIIEKRLRLEVEGKLQWEQRGSRRNHSTQDHLFTIQQLIEKSIRKNKQLYLCFIDTEKAFDTISRNAIWKALEAKQVDAELWQVIKSLYKGTTNEVRAFNQVSERFTTDEGVRQ